MAGLGFSGIGLGAGYGSMGFGALPLALASSPRLVSAGAEGLGSLMRNTEGFRRGVVNQTPNALRINRPITQADPQAMIDEENRNNSYNNALEGLLNQLQRLNSGG